MEVLKIKPYSKEAETALLSCILTDGDLIEEVVPWISNSECFYINEHKIIWEAFLSMRELEIYIDLVTLTVKLKEMGKEDVVTPHDLAGIANAYSYHGNIKQYCTVIQEAYLKRKLLEGTEKLKEGSEENINKLIEEHSHLINEIQSLQPSKKKEISEINKSTLKLLKTKDNIIPYGFKMLDGPLKGATRKEISVIGGRPGHGKTTLAINIAVSMAFRGYKVMLLNREMSNEDVMKKVISIIMSNMSYESLVMGDIGIEEMAVIETMLGIFEEKLRDNFIMYDNIFDLDSSMREIRKFRPDVVIDDYIQLIKPPEEVFNKDRRFQIEDIMNKYKRICKELNMSAILTSQLNREAEKRLDPMPRMSDLAEAGAIEQTAASIIFTFYGHNFDPESSNAFNSNIVIGKNRYGKTDNIKVGFNGNRCRYYKTEEDARKDRNYELGSLKKVGLLKEPDKES